MRGRRLGGNLRVGLGVVGAARILNAHLRGIKALRDAGLADLARRHRDTPMIGRSNLQQAVPITFGYKCATYLAAFERHKQRLQQLKERTFVFEFGGAAGTISFARRRNSA